MVISGDVFEDALAYRWPTSPIQPKHSWAFD